MDDPAELTYLDRCILYLNQGDLYTTVQYALKQRQLHNEYVFNHESNEDIIIFQAHKKYYKEICEHDLNYHPTLDNNMYISETHQVNMYDLYNCGKKFTLDSENCICKKKNN